jgi:hypothetical protein
MGFKATHRNSGSWNLRVTDWKQSNRGQRDLRVVEARGSSGGDRSGADQLSEKEHFESFLRRRHTDGDFVSKATTGIICAHNAHEQDTCPTANSGWVKKLFNPEFSTLKILLSPS